MGSLQHLVGEEPEAVSPVRDRRAGWLTIPLVLVVAAAFAPVLDNGFVATWDDGANFLENRHYRGLGAAQVGWAWTTFRLGVYQPLAWMLLEVQYALCGLQPRGYHLTSLVLHVADTIALYVLTIALLQRCRPGVCRDHPWACPVGAALAVALFAVHPLRVEAVAWASCQPYLACAGFCLLALLAYLHAFRDGTAPRCGWLRGALVLFTAALLCKAVAVSLPVVLLILDVYPLRRLRGGPGRWLPPSARAVWREKAPFVVLSLSFMGLAVAAKESTRTLIPLEHWGLGARVIQACYGIGFYPAKTLLPMHITAFYPLIRPVVWYEPRFLASILGTLGVSVVAFLRRRRRPGLLAAWLSYLVILAPNLGVLQIGRYMAADRYSYLAMMPLVVWVAALFRRLIARGGWARPVAPGVVVAGLGTIGVLVVLTRGQCRTWRDSETLWTHALRHGTRRSDEAHTNLGATLSEQGRLPEAMAQCAEAVRINPDNDAAYHNMGVVLLKQGRLEEAVTRFAQALRINPDHVEAHYGLGVALRQQGKLPEAEAQFRQTLRLDPNHTKAYNNLGVILARQGRLAEAMDRFATAVRVNPDDFEAHINFGVGLLRLGKFAEAAAQFRAALRLKPDHPVARQNLALALEQQAQSRSRPE